MSRPTNKEELIKQANENFEKMWDLINSIPNEEKTKDFNLEGKIKKVI